MHAEEPRQHESDDRECEHTGLHRSPPDRCDEHTQHPRDPQQVGGDLGGTVRLTQEGADHAGTPGKVTTACTGQWSDAQTPSNRAGLMAAEATRAAPATSTQSIRRAPSSGSW